MPRVIATADLHGELPAIPDCEILIIAGDVVPDYPVGKEARYKLPDKGASWQAAWIDMNLVPWLEALKERSIEVVAIAGNHDFVFENENFDAHELPWIYLQDEAAEVCGLKMYGLPWVPGLSRWAFCAPDQYQMKGKLAKIPRGLDILISHGPPFGFADLVGPRFGGPKRVGSEYMGPVLERTKPRVVICGHIHEGYGAYRLPYGGMLYSVPLNDDAYCPDNPVVLLDEFLDKDEAAT